MFGDFLGIGEDFCFELMVDRGIDGYMSDYRTEGMVEGFRACKPSHEEVSH